MKSNVDFTQINKKTYDIHIKEWQNSQIFCHPLLSMINDLNAMIEDHPIESALSISLLYFNHNRNKVM